MTEFLTGTSIYLRSLEMEDVEQFWQWFADREMVRYSMSSWQMPVSKLETGKWLERMLWFMPIQAATLSIRWA